VPLTGVPPQVLDGRREGRVDTPLFEYCEDDDDGGEGKFGGVFETYMRRKYDNCELRSFCLLVKDDVDGIIIGGEGVDVECGFAI